MSLLVGIWLRRESLWIPPLVSHSAPLLSPLFCTADMCMYKAVTEDPSTDEHPSYCQTGLPTTGLYREHLPSHVSALMTQSMPWNNFFPEFPSLLQPPRPCLMGRWNMLREGNCTAGSSPGNLGIVLRWKKNIHGSYKITSKTDISVLQEVCGESFFINMIWIYVGNTVKEIQVLANEDFWLLHIFY